MTININIAQICENGHIITVDIDLYPEKTQKFCEKCGVPTMDKCKNCEANIPGSKFDDTLFVSYPLYEPPSVCTNCGKPYPWIEKKLKATQELAQELNEITPDEKETLIKSVNEIIKDTPETELYAHRFKRIIAKLGTDTYDFFCKFAVDVASQAAKKIITGS